MYFHAGQAASSAIRAVRLALSGAQGSEAALDGAAGFLPAYRPDHVAPDVSLFDAAEPEIMSVYFCSDPHAFHANILKYCRRVAFMTEVDRAEFLALETTGGDLRAFRVSDESLVQLAGPARQRRAQRHDAALSISVLVAHREPAQPVVHRGRQAGRQGRVHDCALIMARWRARASLVATRPDRGRPRRCRLL